jgi:hypothetical protein
LFKHKLGRFDVIGIERKYQTPNLDLIFSLFFRKTANAILDSQGITAIAPSNLKHYCKKKLKVCLVIERVTSWKINHFPHAMIVKKKSTIDQNTEL